MGLETKEGLPAMKPTVLVSNSEILLSPFANMRCKGYHEHGHLVGGRAAAAQIWPWNFANRMVQGIVNLKQQVDHTWLQVAFPSIGSLPGDEPKGKARKHKCQACKNHLSRFVPRRTGIEGECLRY
jgi:hypothetical protein